MQDFIKKMSQQRKRDIMSTITIRPSAYNPSFSDVCDAFGTFYDKTPRSVTIHLEESSRFADEVEVYFHSLAYQGNEPGQMLFIGEMRDVVHGIVLPVEVHYQCHHIPLLRGGHVHVFNAVEC